jgi:hypothetical protein
VMAPLPLDDAHVLADGLDSRRVEQPEDRLVDKVREAVTQRIGLTLGTKRTTERGDDGQFQGLAVPEHRELGQVLCRRVAMCPAMVIVR